MVDTRPYPKSGRRNIFDANNIASVFGENAIVCAPVSVLLIARSLVAQRGLWRTSYAVDYSDDYYSLPDLAFMDTLEEEIAQFLEATNEMNCDDVVSKMTDIVDALNALSSFGGCGCGSSGAGATSPPAETTDTGDITQGTGTPPSGYPNWTVYQENKCDISHWIVSNIRNDLAWLQLANYSVITVSAMATAITAVLSGGTLLLLLAAATALEVYAATSWQVLIDILDDHHDDLVCALMQGTTASSSKALFLAELHDQIDTDILDGITNYLAKQMIDLFADFTQLNLLYSSYGETVNYQIPGGQDCTSCGVTCHNIQMEYGEYLGLDQYRLVFALGEWRCQGNWNTNDTDSTPDPCGPMELITITDVTGYTHSGSGANDFRIYEDGPPLSAIYNSDVPPVDTQFCARRFALLSGGTYDCTIVRDGQC